MKRTVTSIIALGSVSASVVAAQSGPVGEDFQVNAFTTCFQASPVVKAELNGDFRAVWHSESAGCCEPGSGCSPDFDIRMRTIRSSNESQVNSYKSGNQQFPSLAVYNSDGDFVVVWESTRSSGSDDRGRSIQMRRFNSSGTPLEDDVQTNTYVDGDQCFPSVATGADGGFAVVWESRDPSGPTDPNICPNNPTDSNIWMRTFDSTGAPNCDSPPCVEFMVNGFTTGNQLRPAVTGDANGDFIVAWESKGSSGSDEQGYSIQVRRARGMPLGNDFQVNTFIAGDQRRPSIALDAAGDFVVVWDSEGSFGSDNSDSSIQMRTLTPNFWPPTNQVQVNTYTAYTQRRPSVTTDTNGDLLVVWESRGSGTSPGDPDTDKFSIQLRRLYETVDFQVNTFTRGNQLDAAITVGDNGDFLILWKSQGSDSFGKELDTSTLSVQARAFGPNADLAITTVGELNVTPQKVLTYTLRVTNVGPDDVYGAVVRDAFPKELRDVTWTCTATSGSSCTSGPLVGDIADTINILVGGTLTYIASAKVDESTTGFVANTARVSRPAGDPNPHNNTSTDITDLES